MFYFVWQENHHYFLCAALTILLLSETTFSMGWVLQQVIFFCNSLKSTAYNGCKPEQHSAYLQSSESQLLNFCLLGRTFELTNGLKLLYFERLPLLRMLTDNYLHTLEWQRVFIYPVDWYLTFMLANHLPENQKVVFFSIYPRINFSKQVSSDLKKLINVSSPQ